MYGYVYRMIAMNRAQAEHCMGYEVVHKRQIKVGRTLATRTYRCTVHKQ
jgi:hypothetical protein